KVKSYEEGMGLSVFDAEGRVQTTEFEKFYFVNVYFPNANRELSRLSYRLEFNEALLKYLKKLEKTKPVVICGDLNVAHKEIDLARPKDNVGNAGFTAEERAWADKFIKAGFVDTYRLINGDKVEYSWWSYMRAARDRNIGWRIDYFLVSDSLKSKVKDAFILTDVFGSDHCPVGIVLSI
ncbi:MAG: exodeoxyribonuclease III, partial [bacterium]